MSDDDRVALPISDELLDLDEALTRRSMVDPQAAELVKLRVFAGLNIEEAAATQGVSSRTAKRDWAYARAWLGRALATKVVNRAVELDPGHLPAYRSRSRCLFDLRKYREAIHDYTILIESSPGNAQYLTQRGLSYHHLKEHQTALADFDRAVGIDPTYAWIWVCRGCAMQKPSPSGLIGLTAAVPGLAPVRCWSGKRLRLLG